MTDTQQILEELDGVLLAEIEAYEKLLELQHTEKQLAVAHALEPFLANLHAKHHQASVIARLEQRRHNLLSRLTPVLPLPACDVTLEQLSNCVAPPYAATFSHYRTRLQTIVADLQRVNRENNLLLRDSLVFIEGALTFFAQLTADTLTYRQSGDFKPHLQGRLLSGRV